MSLLDRTAALTLLAIAVSGVAALTVHRIRQDHRRSTRAMEAAFAKLRAAEAARRRAACAPGETVFYDHEGRRIAPTFGGFAVRIPSGRVRLPEGRDDRGAPVEAGTMAAASIEGAADPASAEPMVNVKVAASSRLLDTLREAKEAQEQRVREAKEAHEQRLREVARQSVAFPLDAEQIVRLRAFELAETLNAGRSANAPKVDHQGLLRRMAEAIGVDLPIATGRWGEYVAPYSRPTPEPSSTTPPLEQSGQAHPAAAPMTPSASPDFGGSDAGGT